MAYDDEDGFIDPFAVGAFDTAPEDDFVDPIAAEDDFVDPFAEDNFVDPFAVQAEEVDPYLELSKGLEDRIDGPDKHALFSDYLKTGARGGAQIGAGVGWALNRAGLDPEGKIQALGENAAEYWSDSLSPGAKYQQGKSYVEKDPDSLTGYKLGDFTLETVGLAGAESILGTAAGMGAGAFLTKGLSLLPGVSRGVAATLGYSLGEAGVSAPSSGAQAEEEVRAMSDDQLGEHPEFKALIAKGETIESARYIIERAAGGEAAFDTLITTAVLSAPFGNMLDNVINPKMLSGSVAGRTIKGGLTEGIQEFFQSASEQASVNYAIQKYADQRRELGEGVPNAAVGGGIAGFGMGAGFGAFAKPEVGGDNIDTTPPDPLRTADVLNAPDIDTAINSAERATGSSDDTPPPTFRPLDNTGGIPTEGEPESSRLARDLPPDVLDALNALPAQLSNVHMDVLDSIDAKHGEGISDLAEQYMNARNNEYVPTTDEALQQPPGMTPAGEVISSEQITTPLETEPTTFKPPEGEKKPRPEYKPTDLNIKEIPLDKLEVAEELPQFKEGADPKTGVVEPLAGKFDRVGVSPILAWERLDGSLKIVSGRHRRDLAIRSGETTIPGQVMKESEGFTLEHALTADAELNIRDNQGEVKDYANYFKNAGVTAEEAEQRGLLSRSKGRQGITIASEGAAILYDSHQAGEVTDNQAAAIAKAAPNDEALQTLGISQAKEGRSIDEVVGTMQAVKAMAALEDGSTESIDMFGFDETALKAAKAIAKRVAAKKRDIRENINAVKGAVNRPDRAKALGVDVKDPEAIKVRLKELQAESDALDSWATNPKLRAELIAEDTFEVKTKPGLSEDKPVSEIVEPYGIENDVFHLMDTYPGIQPKEIAFQLKIPEQMVRDIMANEDTNFIAVEPMSLGPRTNPDIKETTAAAQAAREDDRTTDAFALETQTEESLAAEAEANKPAPEPAEVPSPEDFVMTGSTAAVDEAEARGQNNLFDQPAKDKTNEEIAEKIDELWPDRDYPSGMAMSMRLAAEGYLNISDAHAEQIAKGIQSGLYKVGATAPKPADGQDNLFDQQANESATSPLNNLPEPTEGQQEAGNYKKGHVQVQGLDITIENPKGSYRTGKDEDGTAWEHEMQSHYGYIKRTEGADGEHVDVFVGENLESDLAVVIDQVDGEGNFDEHKVMLGFNTEAEAIAAYKENYDDNWVVGETSSLSMDALKNLLEAGALTKPISGELPTQQAETSPISDEELSNRLVDMGLTPAEDSEEKQAEIVANILDETTPTIYRNNDATLFYTVTKAVNGDKKYQATVWDKDGPVSDSKHDTPEGIVRHYGYGSEFAQKATQGELDYLVTGKFSPSWPEGISQAQIDEAEAQGVSLLPIDPVEWTRIVDRSDLFKQPQKGEYKNRQHRFYNGEYLSAPELKEVSEGKWEIEADPVIRETLMETAKGSQADIDDWSLPEVLKVTVTKINDRTYTVKTNYNSRYNHLPQNSWQAYYDKLAGKVQDLEQTKEVTITKERGRKIDPNNKDKNAPRYTPEELAWVDAQRWAKGYWLEIHSQVMFRDVLIDQAIDQREDPAIDNSQKMILSLFDYTGQWASPWADAGYTVVPIDIQKGTTAEEAVEQGLISEEEMDDWLNPMDVRDIAKNPNQWLDDNGYGDMEIYGILAACPCTDFTNAGNRHKAAKVESGAMRESIDLVADTLDLIENLDPRFWVIENPVGPIEDLTGLPNKRMLFDPSAYGDPYTKGTALWGKFNNDLPEYHVDPAMGSKFFLDAGGGSIETKNTRSETPTGFAAAFFAANNHAGLSAADRLERELPLAAGAVRAAVEAGFSEAVIRKTVNDALGREADEEFDQWDDTFAAVARVHLMELVAPGNTMSVAELAHQQDVVNAVQAENLEAVEELTEEDRGLWLEDAMNTPLIPGVVAMQINAAIAKDGVDPRDISDALEAAVDENGEADAADLMMIVLRLRKQARDAQAKEQEDEGERESSAEDRGEVEASDPQTAFDDAEAALRKRVGHKRGKLKKKRGLPTAFKLAGNNLTKGFEEIEKDGLMGTHYPVAKGGTQIVLGETDDKDVEVAIASFANEASGTVTRFAIPNKALARYVGPESRGSKAIDNIAGWLGGTVQKLPSWAAKELDNGGHADRYGMFSMSKRSDPVIRLPDWVSYPDILQRLENAKKALPERLVWFGSPEPDVIGEDSIKAKYAPLGTGYEWGQRIELLAQQIDELMEATTPATGYEAELAIKTPNLAEALREYKQVENMPSTIAGRELVEEVAQAELKRLKDLSKGVVPAKDTAPQETDQERANRTGKTFISESGEFVTPEETTEQPAAEPIETEATTPKYTPPTPEEAAENQRIAREERAALEAEREVEKAKEKAFNDNRPTVARVDGATARIEADKRYTAIVEENDAADPYRMYKDDYVDAFIAGAQGQQDYKNHNSYLGTISRSSQSDKTLGTLIENGYREGLEYGGGEPETTGEISEPTEENPEVIESTPGARWGENPNDPAGGAAIVLWKAADGWYSQGSISVNEAHIQRAGTQNGPQSTRQGALDAAVLKIEARAGEWAHGLESKPGLSRTQAQSILEWVKEQKNKTAESPTAPDKKHQIADFGTKNKVVTKTKAEEAIARIKARQTRLKSGIDPEDAVDAVIAATYYIEGGAVKFADYAVAMVEGIGEWIRPYLRQFYENVRWNPDMAEYQSQLDDGATIEEYLKRVTANDERTTGTTEPDRGELPAPGTEENLVDEGRGGIGQGADETGGETGGQRGGFDTPVDQPGSDLFGEPSDTSVSDEKDRLANDAARDTDTGGSSLAGAEGLFAEPSADPTADSIVDKTPAEISLTPLDANNEDLTTDQRDMIIELDMVMDELGETTYTEAVVSQAVNNIAEQMDVEIELVQEVADTILAMAAGIDPAEDQTPITEKAANSIVAKIKAEMPFLTDGQAEDVAFAEARLSKPDGFGVLFTNGTGTGKTFVGLGAIKRMWEAGKKNILIAAPKQPIADAWMKAGAQFFGLNITKLNDTQDAGRGIVVTTFANLGVNRALIKRDWDAFVMDEAHYLAASKEGDHTKALKMLRALSYKRGTEWDRVMAKNPEDAARLDEIPKLIEKAKKDYDYARADALKKESTDIYDRLRPQIEPEREIIAARSDESKARSILLSATPFAYEKTVRWANEFLFDWGADSDGQGQRYNQADKYESFMMQHFGYRMRYNKLTAPEAEVDTGLMQRAFNTWLKNEGVLSGRVLDSEFDYDRKFVLVENAIGKRVDEALQWVRDQAGQKNPLDGISDLNDYLKESFNYHARMYFLEALKARDAVPIIKKHLELGRKVAVFHDFKQGGSINPFRIAKNQPGPAFLEFSKKFQDLIDAFDQIPSVIDTLKTAFPEAGIYNGDVSPKSRVKMQDEFQKDGNGTLNIIIAQADAAREGISLHDTTGKHQRVSLQLGLPVKPTASIQLEGRTYRTGQASDAIFRYLTIGTAWERVAFASTIAQRASAAENLALGEAARGLKQSFIDAYEEADTYAPGHDGEGQGGKELDAAYANVLTPWDMAKTYYFGSKKQGKGRSSAGRENSEYFATPEPLGLKMVHWADPKAEDDFLEPSAGHGAIARWFPENSNGTAIEYTDDLSSKLSLHFDGKVITGDYMDHHISNKYDSIIMNPPFGAGGSQARDHVQLAMRHLRNGGRIVALIPTGPAADKKFEALMESDAAKGVYQVGNILLPAVTFERAGTSVLTRVIILERQNDPTVAATLEQKSRDYTDVTDINDFFDRIEDTEMGARKETRIAGGRETRPPSQVRADQERIDSGEALGEQDRVPAREPEPWVAGFNARTMDSKHTKTGKPLYVVNLTEEMGDNYDTFSSLAKKSGGMYIRARFRNYYKPNDGVKVPGTPTFSFDSAGDRAIFLADIANIPPPGQKGTSYNRTTRKTTGAGMSKASLDRIVQQFLKKYPGLNDVNVEIVDTATDLPGVTAEHAGVYNYSAAYDTNTDTLYMVADTIQSKADAVASLQEELLVHKGLGMFNETELKAVLSKVREMAESTPEMRKLWEGVKRDYADKPVAQQVEELFAKIAHTRMNPIGRAWNDFLRWFRGLMAKYGWIDSQARKGDILAMVYQMGDVFASGERAASRATNAIYTKQDNAPHANWTGRRLDNVMWSHWGKQLEENHRVEAAIATIDPYDFVYATTGSEDSFDNIMAESTDKYRDYLSDPETTYLAVEKNGRGGYKIMGHNGRHRMAYLAKQGVKSAPVLLINRYAETGATTMGIDETTIFDGQEYKGDGGEGNRFDDTVRGMSISVRNAIDVIPANRGDIDEAYGRTDMGGFLYNRISRAAKLTPDEIVEWREAHKVNQRRGRVAEVQVAAKQLEAGELSPEEYNKIVKNFMPIMPIEEVPELTTVADMSAALSVHKAANILGVDTNIEQGTRVASRLDIPAYDFYDTWVVTVHDGSKRGGNAIAYGNHAVMSNVEFVTSPKAALGIATGKTAKAPFARIHGDWQDVGAQGAHDMANMVMSDPKWVQVGMNPFRHSYFYDKATGAPVVAAELAVQVGPLVMAKNVTYAQPTDPGFEVGRESGIYFNRVKKPDNGLFAGLTRRDFLKVGAGFAVTAALGNKFSAPNMEGVPVGKARPISSAILNTDLSPSIVKLIDANDLKGAIELASKTGPAELRGLASTILDLMPDTGIDVVVDRDYPESPDHGTAGLNKRGGVTVSLYTGDPENILSGLRYDTFLHESLHAILMARYRDLDISLSSNYRLFGMAKPVALDALDQFRDLYDEFKKAFRHGGMYGGMYTGEALWESDEFFVRALTDPELQLAMSMVPYKGSTLWNRFKDWVKTKLFGMPSGTAPSWLDAALMGAQDIIDVMGEDPADYIFANKAFEFNRQEHAEQGVKFVDERKSNRRTRAGATDMTPAEQAVVDKAGFGVNHPVQNFVSKWNRFRANMGTRLHQGLVDQYRSFKDILGDDRAWMMGHLTKSSIGTIEAVVEHGRPFLDDGAIGIDTTKKSLKEILEPLGEDLDRWTWWIAGNRASRLKAEERENLFDDNDIAVLKAMNQNTPENPDREALFERVRVEFEELADSINRIAVETGLMNEEEVDRWMEEGFYLPFYRVMEESEQMNGPRIGGTAQLIRQQAYKHLKGGKEKLGDLLGNSLLNWNHIIHASLNNQAARQALEAAETLGYAQRVLKKRKSKKAIYVRENGVEKWWELDESSEGKLVLESLTMLNSYGLNGYVMQAMRAFKRALTVGVTASPEFKIRNLIRDTLSAIAVTDMSTNVAKNLAGGLKATGENAETKAQMLAGGAIFGDSGYQHGADPEVIRHVIKKGTHRETILDTRYAIKKWWDKYQDFGARLENVNRAANYVQDIERGRGRLAANFNARDHLDFTRQGSFVAIRFIAQVVPFFNARLQGLDKLARAARTTGQKGQFFAVVGAYSIMSVLLYLLMRDDDDYKETEDWERDTYHLFKVPGSDILWRIPRPFEVGAIASMAERAVEQLVNDDVHGSLFAERILHTLGETFSFNPMPQAVKPALEVAMDTNWFTGSPIEGMSLRNLSPVNRKRAWTSDTAIAISEGMDTITWGKVVLSPVQVQHLVRGYFGWLGATTLAGADMFITEPIAGAPPDPAMRWTEYPIAKAFTRSGPNRNPKQIGLFYDRLNEISEAYADIRLAAKEEDQDAIDRIKAESGNKIALRRVYNKVSKKLSKINAKMSQVVMDQNMTAQEKRAEMDRLQVMKNDLTMLIDEKTRQYF